MVDMREFFNERAAAWDKSAVYEPEKIRIMLELSDIAGGSNIMDIACGTGVLEPYLLEYEPKTILAVDFAENMIRVAREKLTHPAVTFVCSDIFELSDISYDYGFIYNAFPHFSDPEALIRHIATLLRRGGRLTISHPQGKRMTDAAQKSFPCFASPFLPAQGIVNMLKKQFRVDVMIDNNVMYLVSAIRL